ncbi:restriction enzyme, beta subunit [Alkalibacterium sp. AK22]|uniref:restriction endonuclease subunit S n=1 Tax=Alkalibacterium sp. AK22 TaxID=1229520 RepID=UPI00044BE477|nr:restriction endonuclease subunit S [Alkalibacterium sp. AK22]EXJ23871.1 restriction enzyme, beta subunit [Alkalibacterium sp. AK22]
MGVLVMRFKPFPITSVFNITRGDRYKSEDHIAGDTPYISSTKLNNGIDSLVTPPESSKVFSNAISLSNSGSIGYAFYHPYKFIASDHVTVLELKNKELNKKVFLFLKPIVEMMRSKYNFGREISNTRLKREKIILPVNQDDEISWDYMENKILEITGRLKFVGIKRNSSIEQNDLDFNSWKEFRLEEVVDIYPGVRLTKADMLAGSTPFIGASSKNHGITNFVDNMNGSCDKDVLGVNYNGSIADSFYHKEKSLFSDDVKRIKIKSEDSPSKLKYLFLKTIIYQSKKRFPYGYKLSEERLKQLTIIMPSKDDKPDWDKVEDIMSKVGYSYLLS